ncbi:MAG: aspartate-semialdehyde dehydrogenase [Proteobacteria bacterium]|nr:aspartate-semialdehyde dehydrogenase [Pseudomonadota bacterium]
MKEFNVAVAGATGAVGDVFLEILAQRNFPIKNLKLLASERSVGKKIKFKGEEFVVEKLDKDSFQNIDIALFSAGGDRSKEFAPYAVQSGAVVVDNSSAFRMDPEIPLVVPEVNPQDIALYKKRGIIANPNCTTIIMVVPLKPLHDYAKIKRIVVSTYQAVSGAGAKAMAELESQIRQYVNGEEIKVSALAYQIAFNLIPQIDIFTDNLYTKEEMKMVNETRKIMGDSSINITATTVRVPVFRCHSESVTIETEKKITRQEAVELLSKAPGVTVIDDPQNKKYPMPLFLSGTDDCYVGRIREDISCEKGLSMWIVGDQLRKGAALNAIQIAEILGEKYL